MKTKSKTISNRNKTVNLYIYIRLLNGGNPLSNGSLNIGQKQFSFAQLRLFQPIGWQQNQTTRTAEEIPLRTKTRKKTKTESSSASPQIPNTILHMCF